MLENVVFLLIGLQLRTILQDVADSDLGAGRLAAICLTVLAAVVAVRFAYVFGSQALHRFGGPRMRRRSWPTSSSTVVSWAGMRGVVTLAAAFLLPPETPQRDVLLLAAFTVVAGTLLVLSPTLPWLVRRLGLSGPDAAEDALQAAVLADEASRAGLARLDRVLKATDPQEVVDELRDRARRRPNMIWERLGRSNDVLEPPSAAYVRLRLEMLAAEREVIVARRDSGTIDDEVLREALTMVDREESLLDQLRPAERRIGQDELVAPARTSGDCEHLRDAPRTARAATPGGCEDCLREGTRWVHLRMCLACGHVGCCDSSVGRHADRHFHDAGHPVMRSIEPGEAWRWCYIDEHLG